MAGQVHLLSKSLERERPDAVFAPHAEDFHSTHIGTHFLVVDAVRDYQRRTGRGPLPLVETEFWRQHACPNFMVGISSADEATLIMAIAEHGGEVRRNPYHLRHPGRMIDNVRRGAEVVRGQGGAAPDFPFGELYRVTFVAQKGCRASRPGGLVIAPGEKIDWQKLIQTFWPEEPGEHLG